MNGYTRRSGHLVLVKPQVVIRDKVCPTHFNGDKIYFADELKLAFFIGGVCGCFLTVLLAGVWAWVGM
jgi:hypothetical protein